MQAQTNDLTAPSTWRLAWTYDRYGNRLTQTLTGGTIAVGQPQLTVDVLTNHINGLGYDANGNLIHDGQNNSNSYTFDAENRMIQSLVGSTTASYAYDGNGLRIQKTVGATTTTYIFSGTKVIAEYTNGSLSKEYVYSGSKLLATVTGTAVTYHHPDHLSNRLETDSSGATTRTFGHLPFGESWYETGTADKWQFTTYERDGAGSGLDYAVNRYYSNSYGRFTSVDRLAGSLLNPQSLNRYSYVANDPLNMVDPLGLDIICVTWSQSCAGGPTINEGTNCHFEDSIEISLDPSPQMFLGGGHGGGGGGKTPGRNKGPKVNLQALMDCIFSQFGVVLTDFVPSQESSAGAPHDVNGSFSGLGPDVLNGDPQSDPPFFGEINVTNDVQSFSVSYITQLAKNSGALPPGPVGVAHGFTDIRAPYTNYTGSGHLDPQDVLDTQIWELGNSLERITGQPGGNSPDESGAQNLQDCYHNGGPKKQ